VDNNTGLEIKPDRAQPRTPCPQVACTPGCHRRRLAGPEVGQAKGDERHAEAEQAPALRGPQLGGHAPSLPVREAPSALPSKRNDALNDEPDGEKPSHPRRRAERTDRAHGEHGAKHRGEQRQDAASLTQLRRRLLVARTELEFDGHWAWIVPEREAA